MTAYANRNVELPMGTACWQLRSLNHRFLEISFKLPEIFQNLEDRFRDKIRKCLKRGRIECYLKLEPTLPDQAPFELDNNLIQKLVHSNQEVQKHFPNAMPISVSDILRWPSMIQMAKGDQTDQSQLIEESFQLALDDLEKTRAREGSKLQQCLQEKIEKMTGIIAHLQIRIPIIQQDHQAKLKEKISSLQLEVNHDRLEQEVVYSMQKSDVSEEIDRLKIHLSEVARVLSIDESAGKRLDFLMQELNRETNTLGAKAIDHTLSKACIDLKVLVEEMREQIQNIE
jgi:uncharacterized protein (TIGR00255 family)